MNEKLAKRIRNLIKSEEWNELEDLLLNTEDDWVLEVSERRGGTAVMGSDRPLS